MIGTFPAYLFTELRMSTPRVGTALALGVALTAATVSGCAREGAAIEPREPVSYFIADGDPEGGFRDSDHELARWALEAWGRQAEPPLELVPGPAETATIRVFWVSARDGLYGEMRPRRIGEDRVGADVFVRPELRGLGADIEAAAAADDLFRETIVYLTCVHEIGHAFGLEHTSSFADIMYSFQHGGDFVAYFRRFRDRIERRADIPRASPFSRADGEALRAAVRR